MVIELVKYIYKLLVLYFFVTEDSKIFQKFLVKIETANKIPLTKQNDVGCQRQKSKTEDKP